MIRGSCEKTRECILAALPGQQQGEGDVLHGRQLGHELPELEHEPEAAPAQLAAFGLAPGGFGGVTITPGFEVPGAEHSRFSHAIGKAPLYVTRTLVGGTPDQMFHAFDATTGKLLWEFKTSSGIDSLAKLNGKNVATTTGTTSVQTLRKNERAGGIDFKELYGKDHSDSFLLLESGRADAFVMDGSILASNIAKSKSPAEYKIVGEVLSVEPIAIMIRKDDAAFKKVVDDSIKAQIKNGELAKLWDKWFLKPIPPANVTVNLPLSDATKSAWANPNDKPMEEYAAKK